jgi:hypothetical protein
MIGMPNICNLYHSDSGEFNCMRIATNLLPKVDVSNVFCHLLYQMK